jgi:hypothetical protein
VYGNTWTKVIDTYDGLVDEEKGTYRAGEAVIVQGRSVVVLKKID